MRLDHIALRTADRYKTAEFYVQCLGYKIATEFPVIFDDGSKADCLVLEPPEKDVMEPSMFVIVNACPCTGDGEPYSEESNQPISDPCFKGPWHLAPEIFISDGTPDSIVGRWVAERNNIGGIHHMAYQVESVDKTMAEWKAKGFAEFSSEPIVCHDENGRQTLKQVFTKPSQLIGYIIELIERDKDGFCMSSVKQLMESTVK